MRWSFLIGDVALALVLSSVGWVGAAPPTQGTRLEPTEGAAPGPPDAPGDEVGPNGKSHQRAPPAPPARADSVGAEDPAASNAELTLGGFPFRYLGMFAAGDGAPRPILVRGSKSFVVAPGEVLDEICRVETVSPDGMQVLILASRERRFVSFAQIAVRSERPTERNPANAGGEGQAPPPLPGHNSGDPPEEATPSGAAEGAPVRNNGDDALRSLMGLQEPNPDESLEAQMGLQEASDETGSRASPSPTQNPTPSGPGNAEGLSRQPLPSIAPIPAGVNAP